MLQRGRGPDTTLHPVRRPGPQNNRRETAPRKASPRILNPEVAVHKNRTREFPLLSADCSHTYPSIVRPLLPSKQKDTDVVPTHDSRLLYQPGSERHTTLPGDRCPWQIWKRNPHGVTISRCSVGA